MSEIKALIDLLEKKERLVAMLAPSFPIVYRYPAIVGKLKRLGFGYVVEVAAGARKTNEGVMAALKETPESRFITSPCPSLVRMVRQKHPHLKKYLALTADSPMAATAKIVADKYPGHRPVFIGPCIAKKFESAEDYPELNILVLTYKEMNRVFEHFGLEEEANSAARFDIEGPETRLYPISGGLAQSSNVREMLADDRLRVVSGWQNCIAAIEEFEKNPEIRLVDILFCDGGCINGPGIVSSLSLEERREKVVKYWSGSTRAPRGRRDFTSKP